MPQDLDYPSLRIDVDRLHAAKLGLTESEVLTNVITSLTSNQMIAPESVDRSAERQQLFPHRAVSRVADSLDPGLCAPFRCTPTAPSQPTRLDMVANIHRMQAPTEVDHYQIRRKLDIYVRPASGESWRGRRLRAQLIAHQQHPGQVNVAVRGSAEAMHASFKSFAIGLTLSVVLLYLILVAQFRSFIDPFIILLALPPGISGVLLALVLTGTTLNVMSLMGVVMLAGIAMSNSILIVEFAHHLRTKAGSVRRP